jgi:hypothetical protein
VSSKREWVIENGMGSHLGVKVQFLVVEVYLLFPIVECS